MDIAFFPPLLQNVYTKWEVYKLQCVCVYVYTVYVSVYIYNVAQIPFLDVS